MDIKYPRGTSQRQSYHKKNKKVEYGKRGMKFEDMINESNQYLLATNQAVIHKKPTPIQIVKVDYPKRSAAKITEAYFRHASTTDYNGVFEHYYIDFEAKETKNKTSFPLNNFHEHQIIHMSQCEAQGGICFVLLWFSTLNSCYYLDFKYLLNYWNDQKQGRKSIPLAEIKKYGHECAIGFAPQIDFITPLKNRIIREKGAH